MGDVMLHGVLNMPLPDDPSELDIVTWIQFRDRAREASQLILADETAHGEAMRKAARIASQHGMTLEKPDEYQRGYRAAAKNIVEAIIAATPGLDDAASETPSLRSLARSLAGVAMDLDDPKAANVCRLAAGSMLAADTEINCLRADLAPLATAFELAASVKMSELVDSDTNPTGQVAPLPPYRIAGRIRDLKPASAIDAHNRALTEAEQIGYAKGMEAERIDADERITEARKEAMECVLVRVREMRGGDRDLVEAIEEMIEDNPSK